MSTKFLFQFKTRNEKENYFKNFSFISKLNIFPNFPKCVFTVCVVVGNRVEAGSSASSSTVCGAVP